MDVFVMLCALGTKANAMVETESALTFEFDVRLIGRFWRDIQTKRAPSRRSLYSWYGRGEPSRLRRNCEVATMTHHDTNGRMKATEAKKLLFVLPFLKYFFPLSCFAFKHRNCRRAISVQFQFPDCFIPSMNPYMLLSEASFLMSHDAATGYLTSKRGVSGISGATNLYAKNQRGSVYDQLNNGARALDVRPRLLQNGTVLLHHGAIGISVTLKTLVLDAIRWCNENPDELVLIFHSNLVYQQNVQPDADTAANALSQVYNRLGVAYAECDDIYGATVQETMEMAELSSGGYLLALDRHDAYASFCGKSNYIGDQIVTCYPNNTLPCTNSKSPSHSMLKDYVLACANNDASDSSYVLGPPESLCDYPFNSIQGLWQVDTHSAAMGVAHVSSIIDDNTKSRINADLVDWIYNGEFDAISLLMVDHVALNGNALLSVLRNTCGQSELADDSCGMAISKPRIKQKLMSTLSFSVTIAVYLGFLVWIAVMFRHYKTYYQHEHQMQRMKDDLKAAERQVQNVMACGVLT